MSGIQRIKVTQIKGSNGSGKTTIVKQLLDASQDCEVVTLGVNPVTVMHDLGWVAIGEYPEGKRMGGTDNYSGMDVGVVQRTKDALSAVIKEYPDSWVVFEGMVLSTIKSTFYEYLKDLHIAYGIEPVFVILETTVDGCLERIQHRRGPKPNGAYAVIREGTRRNVGAKCEMILRTCGPTQAFSVIACLICHILSHVKLGPTSS